jgi:uncharacterized lipoprotein YmbA
MNSWIIRLTIVFLFAVFLLQAGCSRLLAPRPDLTRFYLLAPLSEMGSRGTTLFNEPGLSDISLGLGPVKLPGYLDREHIVTRLSPNRVDVSAFDRWAEPLAPNFNRVLTENLATLLGTKKIDTYPFSGPRPDYEIQIDIVRFEPTEDYSADLAAHWFLKDGKTKQVLLARDSIVKRQARSASMSGSVGALSEALGELSIQIATAIHQAHSQVAAARPRGP